MDHVKQKRFWACAKCSGSDNPAYPLSLIWIFWKCNFDSQVQTIPTVILLLPSNHTRMEVFVNIDCTPHTIWFYMLHDHIKNKWTLGKYGMKLSNSARYGLDIVCLFVFFYPKKKKIFFLFLHDDEFQFNYTSTHEGHFSQNGILTWFGIETALMITSHYFLMKMLWVLIKGALQYCLISPEKHLLWVLIWSASQRHF